MLKIFVLFLCTITYVKCSLEYENKNQLKLSVYYETLCPYSQSYIYEKLYPAWKALDGEFYLQLVPYGNAKHQKKNGKWEFVCQHGEEECHGNKIHGCILKMKNLSDHNKMNLIACTLDPDEENSLEECTSQYELSHMDEEIKQCADGSQGDDILAAYGDLTKTVHPRGVPYLIFNDVYNSENSKEARKNTTSTICKLAVDKPSKC